MAKAITQQHGAVTLLSIRPTTKPSSSCHLLLIVCLGGSCHSSIHLSLSGVCHLSPRMLTFLQPPSTMQRLNVVKKSSLSSLSSSPHCMQSPSLFPLLSPVLLSLRLISSLFFAPAPPHICIWMSRSLPGLRVVLATCICVRILCVKSSLHHQKL